MSTKQGWIRTATVESVKPGQKVIWKWNKHQVFTITEDGNSTNPDVMTLAFAEANIKSLRQLVVVYRDSMKVFGTFFSFNKQLPLQYDQWEAVIEKYGSTPNVSTEFETKLHKPFSSIGYTEYTKYAQVVER